MGLPTVILGGYKPEKPISRRHRVLSDSLAIGEMAAEHLLDCGYRKFAYCSFHNIFWSQERESLPIREESQGTGKRSPCLH